MKSDTFLKYSYFTWTVQCKIHEIKLNHWIEETLTFTYLSSSCSKTIVV